MMILFFALQAAEPLPTIQLNARVEAREVIVERRGTASLTVTAEPDAGSRVEVVERRAAKGERRIRNYRADIDARATIADPQAPLESEPAPQDGEAAPPDEG